MKYKNISITLSAMALLLNGCATGPTVVTIWKSDPAISSVDNEYYSAQITPQCHDLFFTNGCESFELSIHNKTKSSIELDWNKTLYVEGGQSAGGFMFEGIVYKDRNSPKSPDIIFEGGNLKKTIWPNKLVSFETGKYGGWKHEVMGEGTRGVYLTVVVNGKEKGEKIITRIYQQQETRP